MKMNASFLSPGTRTSAGQLASLHLSRDQQLPVILSTSVSSAQAEGYAEGVVTNTRFGSFPHSTLIGVPWGTQILASKVDTGSRGRNQASKGRKRKAEAISTDQTANTSEHSTYKEAVAASSGFVHILPPTPETWTTSLPHRTQVVYTPDYSYILHRIRARPGGVLIEAGSGSGSFTHAAARAVHNGSLAEQRGHDGHPSRPGHVFTFEYHEARYKKVLQEMQEHNLEHIVTATHRDVYKGGFLLREQEGGSVRSPQATCIFLDLPAPWEALHHLTREHLNEKPSALDPYSTVHICSFSPCIEQVQKTVSALRRHGWLEIEMVEMQQKRIDVRREFTGLQFDGMRGVNAAASNVHEALVKLKEAEQRTQEFHSSGKGLPKMKKQAEQNKQQDANKVLFKEGRLVHRTEPEIKTHTSYLVFALLPRSWNDADAAHVNRV